MSSEFRSDPSDSADLSLSELEAELQAATPVPFTEEQVERILAFARSGPRGHRNDAASVAVSPARGAAEHDGATRSVRFWRRAATAAMAACVALVGVCGVTMYGWYASEYERRELVAQRESLFDEIRDQNEMLAEVVKRLGEPSGLLGVAPDESGCAQVVLHSGLASYPWEGVQ